MESSERSKSVIELGKRLVDHLALSDDLLAQWMAHDIAERMDAVERAGPEAPTWLREECAKSITTLWAHRHELPPHLRAFRELEPLIQTLVSLDVDKGEDYRYFGSTLRGAAIDDTEGETKEWLNLAFDLDYSARVLIQHALRSAGSTAVSKTAPWVEAALNAGVDVAAEQIALKLLLDDFYDSAETECIVQKALGDKIDRLERFAKLANTVAADMRKQRDSANSSGPIRPDE